jgi:transposase-like protein
MARRSTPKTPQKIIAQVVKRHIEGGENAEALAKEFKVSRASVYGWVTKYKNEILARSRRAGMSPLDADRADKTELIAELEALKLENRKLRELVLNSMLKSDPSLSPPSGVTVRQRKTR